MASHYSVIRYVPNPISEEAINIGVAVFGAGLPRFRFTGNWIRARQFGGEGTEFLERFARQLGSQQFGIFSDSSVWDEAQLRKVLGRWHNSIQFTPPRASLKEPEALLDEVSGLFLRNADQRASRRGTRLQTKMKKMFTKMKVLAKEGKEIKKHKVVVDYPIDQRTGLYAEFALKNRVFHVMETVDYRNMPLTGLAKFYETGAKAFVLAKAKQTFGQGTKRYAIYSAYTNDRSAIRKHLALLGENADEIINYDSRRDLAAFGSLISKAAGNVDLVTS